MIKVKFRRTVFLILLLSLICCKNAAAIPLDVDTREMVAGESTLRAELTEWCYRIYNGVLQRRLWSITQNMWLTDWENF